MALPLLPQQPFFAWSCCSTLSSFSLSVSYSLTMHNDLAIQEWSCSTITLQTLLSLSKCYNLWLGLESSLANGLTGDYLAAYQLLFWTICKAYTVCNSLCDVPLPSQVWCAYPVKIGTPTPDFYFLLRCMLLICSQCILILLRRMLLICPQCIIILLHACLFLFLVIWSPQRPINSRWAQRSSIPSWPRTR